MLQKSAPEIGTVSLDSTSDSGVRCSCRRMTSNVIDCLQAPKAVSDVRSRASAPKTGAGIWHQIYGDGFWSVCQGPEITCRLAT